MARSDLDICLRAHHVARTRNRNDLIFGIISRDQMRARSVRIDRAFDARWRKVVGVLPADVLRRELIESVAGRTQPSPELCAMRAEIEERV